ncbi:hypothetical protein WJX72_002313 [[Myrmecia] bisecta]|uniref:DNA-directed RNA polymerase III subunit RPC3 n=1 Tax=[Myrmecia] bisecta TaxID=41462 RepID=A0AAW1R5F2_9CHLO
MAHNSPYAHQLACSLIAEQFGPICEKVCQALLRHGVQSLGELIRNSGLPAGQIRNGLLVLIQHNCAIVYQHHPEPGLRVAAASYYLYEPATAAILQNLRKPRFLLLVKDEYVNAQTGEDGTIHETIVEVLLENGRLTLEQIILATAEKLEQTGEEGRASIKRRIMHLMHDHLLEQAPPCDMPRPDPAVHENAQKRRGAPKPGSQDAASQEAEAARKLAEEDYAKARFQLPRALILDEIDADTEAGALFAASERKRRKLGNGQAVPGGEGSKEGAVLWRVNTDECNRRLRHAACVRLVTQKRGTDVGAALAALLAASCPFETKLKEHFSVEFAEVDILKAAQRLADAKPEAYVMPADMTACLRELVEDDLRLAAVGGEGPNGTGYFANESNIINIVKVKEVEAVVRERFGALGLRVFRLLLLSGQLEQKQIADQAMMPLKDCRELLYRMLKAGFVGLQDIPKTADHAPSRTFYTWRVAAKAAADLLAAELYREAHNIRTRLDHEMLQQREVLEMVEGGNGHILHTHRGPLERIKKVSAVLETCLLQVDALIAIFNDF